MFDEREPILRDAPLVASRRAESNLFHELHQAATSLENTDDFGRSGIIRALRAVVVFLDGRGARGHLLQPFTLLRNAFRDLEREDAAGRAQTPELFRSKPIDILGDPVSAQSQSYPKRKVKLHTAACMEHLIRQAKSQKSAATMVARATNKWPKIDMQQINDKTVANWRRMYLELPIDDPDHLDFQELVYDFGKNETGQEYFELVMKKGPPLMGGLQPR